MKKTLGNLIIVVVLLVVVGVGNVLGADVYTTGTSTASGSGTIAEYASSNGATHVCNQFALNPQDDAFTLDGVYRDDVWAIVLSEINGQYIFNGYGRSFDNGSGTMGFEFYTYGTPANPLVQASQIIFILNDDDPELFWINNGTLLLGSAIGGDDIVLGQECVSINGKAFGDISDIRFDYHSGYTELTSVELVTPPIMIDSPENTATGINPNSSLVWEGDAASEFEVHLYDDKGGPVYVFPDLTDTSLDVNGYLDWNTTYNWQVDEVIGGEVTYSSPVWTFTTIGYHCQEDIVGDLNGDCIVSLADFAMMAGNWLEERQKIANGS